jgi:3-hydroxybutyryl-CoA dehydratase
MTVYYDELKPGLSDSVSKEITERDVELFGEVSGDHNPVHFDEAFARKTIFRGRIAHGALTLSLLSAVLGLKLPGPGTAVLEFKTRFKAPVRIGDTVTAVCTVREVLPKRRVLFDCLCKVGDSVVVESEALVMAPARP